MDNDYLKKNVLPALTEALGAMAIQVPDDKVEFLGKYLLTYVERKAAQTKRSQEIVDVEAKLSVQLKIDEETEKSRKEKLAPSQYITTQFQRLLEGIPLRPTKEEAADTVVNFLETTMNLPAAYYAAKAVAGETEYLKYLAAGPSSKMMIGVKLNKPAVTDETSDEFIERQGVSFEALRVPEVPEEEATEEAEGEGEVQKKGPPPLQNLIIRNVMLDRRVKFYGIPKLGAYVACPFKYASYDHDGAVRFNAGDGAEVPSSFELVQADNSFIIAFDSIGKYRHFTEEEINRVGTIGNTLIQLYEKLEGKAAEKQLEYLNGAIFKNLNDTVTEVTAKIVEEEAAALAAVQPAEGADPPPPEIAEFIKPKTDTAAVLNAWSKVVGGGSLGGQLNTLEHYLLPLPSSALKLFYAIALFLNLDPVSVQDVTGELTWELFKKNILPTIANAISSYQPDASISLVSSANSLNSVKAYIETNQLSDTSIYPN